jgi:nucleoside-diphosphate-sugar epimerase
MNVFGPRQDPTSPYSGVLSIFCRAAIQGDGVTIFGDGSQTRDFVFVRDVVQANLLASQLPANQMPPYPVFNVGRGEQTTINEVVDMLSELAQQAIPITHGPERPGDIKHSVADISQAQQLLGFQPQVTVLEGLNSTLAWFRLNPPSP